MAKYQLPTKEEIKQARQSLGLTQREVAEMCCIDTNTWARYEQGSVKISSPVWELFTTKIKYTNLLHSLGRI